MLLKRKNEALAPPSVRSDINVTPLVDVCLVLLIIFMVVTPMLQKGVDVALPETVDPTKMPETQKQLTVSVKADGSVFVQQNWVQEEQIPQTLKEIHDQNPEKTVVVKGDRRLKYKDVRKVMRLINEAGFTRVGLVIDKKTQGLGA
jgi:biopolymer transport protein TolR